MHRYSPESPSEKYHVPGENAGNTPGRFSNSTNNFGFRPAPGNRAEGSSSSITAVGTAEGNTARTTQGDAARTTVGNAARTAAGSAAGGSSSSLRPFINTSGKQTGWYKQSSNSIILPLNAFPVKPTRHRKRKYKSRRKSRKN